MFEPETVDRPGARLIHNPPDDRSVGRIVSRRPSPHIVEHIERHFFSGFAVVGYPHYQCKNDSIRLFVKRIQRKLIPCGHGLDEPDPVLLGHAKLSLIDIEHIAEGPRLRFTLILVRTHDVYTRDGKHAPVNWWPSRAARLNETHSDPLNKRQNSSSGFLNWKINTDGS